MFPVQYIVTAALLVSFPITHHHCSTGVFNQATVEEVAAAAEGGSAKAKAPLCSNNAFIYLSSDTPSHIP